MMREYEPFFRPQEPVYYEKRSKSHDLNPKSMTQPVMQKKIFDTSMLSTKTIKRNMASTMKTEKPPYYKNMPGTRFLSDERRQIYRSHVQSRDVMSATNSMRRVITPVSSYSPSGPALNAS